MAYMLDSIVDRVPTSVVRTMSHVKARVRRELAARRIAGLVRRDFASASSTEVVVAFPEGAVVRIQLPEQQVIMKVAFVPVEAERLDAQVKALDELRSLELPRGFHELTASVIDSGAGDGDAWFTQSLLPGKPVAEVEASWRSLGDDVERTLRPLYELTAKERSVDDESFVDTLIRRPFERILHARPTLADRVAVVERALVSRLTAEQSVLCSRIHGDLAPSNVLVEPTSHQVTGLIDWRFDAEHVPHEIDLVHFAIACEARDSSAEYGDIVGRVLRGGTEDSLGRAVKASIGRSANSFSPDFAVALTWLHHVGSGLEKKGASGASAVWLAHNVDHVLDVLAETYCADA